VQVNSDLAIRALTQYGTGGLIPNPAGKKRSSDKQQHGGVDLTDLIQEQRLTRKAIQDQQVNFNTRSYDEYKARQVQIETRAGKKS
jgi:hypothetical protein